ncbi:MAG TPA: SRPBCC domain-containing protein [Actinomycetota bacterium]
MSAQRELTLTRIIDAPRELVFKAWTEPEQVAKWWGPDGFTAPVVELDPRPGGALRVDMQGPDGVVYPNTGEFLEVVEPERLVVTTRLLDGDGNVLVEDVNTITFEDEGGKTKVTVHARVIKATPEAAEALEGMDDGWNQTLDRMVRFVTNAA